MTEKWGNSSVPGKHFSSISFSVKLLPEFALFVSLVSFSGGGTRLAFIALTIKETEAILDNSRVGLVRQHVHVEVVDLLARHPWRIPAGKTADWHFPLLRFAPTAG